MTRKKSLQACRAVIAHNSNEKGWIRNLWDPLAFNLPEAGFENCAMRFSWLKSARRWTGGNRSFLPHLSTLHSGKRPTQNP